jgi:hypothetical protein
MQVVRLNALSNEKLITPSGKRTTAKDWYKALKLTYKPIPGFGGMKLKSEFVKKV